MPSTLLVPLRVFPLIVALVTLWVTAPAPAEANSLEPVVSGFVESTGLRDDLPGMAVVVTRDGRSLLERCIGVADLKTRPAIGPDTPFRLASLTKPFTALAALQLAEKGRLTLDQPVAALLPEFPYPDITPHHLLTHTSGLPEYTSFNFFAARPDNEGIVRMLRDRPLSAQPGVAMKYNNTGYVVLASLIERASGEPYERYLRDHVFRPAGMEQSSVPRLMWRDTTGRAVGYRRKLGIFFPYDEDVLNGVVGAGGIYASARDIDRWLDALHGRQLLREKSLRRAFEPSPVSRRDLPYGYGWVITRFADDILLWHNGTWLGFDTFAGHLVHRNVNLVLLSNAGLTARDVDLAGELAFPLVEALVTSIARASAPNIAAP